MVSAPRLSETKWEKTDAKEYGFPPSRGGDGAGAERPAVNRGPVGKRNAVEGALLCLGVMGHDKERPELGDEQGRRPDDAKHIGEDLRFGGGPTAEIGGKAH